MRQRLRLLYLTIALPPGVSGRFPALNTGGHVGETRMAQALAQSADVSTVGLLPGEIYGRLEPRDDSIGLEHDLLLFSREPALWHRWRSWRRLRHYYLSRVARHNPPDAVLFKNITPEFHYFARWLRRQPHRPKLVLVLGDSATLGQKISLSRRLRYAFKPMQTLSDRAILAYDACLSAGVGTRKYFEPRGVPWVCIPPAFNHYFEPPPTNLTGPIRFGYFGALAEHASVIPLVKAFLASPLPNTLHVCGFGKLSGQLKELAAQNPRFHFDGLLPKQSDCLAWAQQVDVLINPRLPVFGLENSFPSKILEYSMTGRAILTTRLCGVDEMLGNEASYLELDHFESSLRQKVSEMAATDRAELRRRGAAIRERILKNYNWDVLGRRMIEFLEDVVNSRPPP